MKSKGMSLKAYTKKELTGKGIRVAYEASAMHLKVARLLEELRQKAGWTQAELANKAGVSQPMIARMERGDLDRIPTLSTINKVFGALGYEVGLVVKRVA
jgi:DNA-binding XRE family transcriptional regulator